MNAVLAQETLSPGHVSISDSPDVGAVDVGRVHRAVCSPSVASGAQAPTVETSNISRHLAGLTDNLSKLLVGDARITLSVPSILGGWRNVSTQDRATAVYKVAKPTAHLLQRLATVILPTTTPKQRRRFRIGTQGIYLGRFDRVSYSIPR